MIRELHVYGQTLAVNTGLKGVQHQGLGTRLVNEAISLAKSHGHDKIAVISGTGVRNYYRRFGFELEGNNNYMTRPI
jgi:elongator complex protein 3